MSQNFSCRCGDHSVASKMCHQNLCSHSTPEEAVTAEENLLIYCKPVELYNILHHRAVYNPTFLRRCLKYKMEAKRKRRLLPGTVIFNYRDYSNVFQKTEVTEDFSCPFCLMQCASFKGMRYHLRSSHDLFDFDFWVSEEFQAVNVSVKIDSLRSEAVINGVDPQLETFFFCSRQRRKRLKQPVQNEKNVNIQFLELDSPVTGGECRQYGYLEKDPGDSALNSSANDKDLSGKNGAENCNSDCRTRTDIISQLATSGTVAGASIAMAQSPMDPDCGKSSCGNDLACPPAKQRKLSADRSEPKHRMLLLKRQFFHSHRVQPMSLEQVLSDRDSEDEVDDDIADLEDCRMLDDFVDVSKDEKQLMHLWNSFVRKQRVLADGHVPWACEAFSKHHKQQLLQSPALFWCWRLLMIKLWNHGLLDASTMNNCNLILEERTNTESNAAEDGDRVDREPRI